MNSFQQDSSATIIPGSGIQFLDVRFNATPLAKVRRIFAESPLNEIDEGVLLCLEERDEQWVDRTSGFSVDKVDEEIILSAAKVLEVYEGKWLPLPLLRIERFLSDQGAEFAPGPTNWCRVRVDKLQIPDSDGDTHSLTIALDTVLEKPEPLSPELPLAGLTEADLAAGREFALAYHERDCGSFLAIEWIDDWLFELYESHQRQHRKRATEDEPRFLYIARYLTFLEALANLNLIPRVRLIDSTRLPVVDVDLVLDVGNSRTCGVLVESHPDQPTDLNDGYVLELRDLSEPWQRYREPFESRVEFALADFGDPGGFSKSSGRATEAFFWPSLVRVGQEASRLAWHSKGADGRTGLSSPKRYLWDREPRQGLWRFNSGPQVDCLGEPPVIRGGVTELINDLGTPTSKARRRKELDSPVIRPQFCRSALTHFMLGEILAQALSAINSVGQRERRRNAHYPRRLRRLILTMPTAMSIAERKRFEELARWAVELIWDALGWGEWYKKNQVRKRRSEDADFRLAPDVVGRYDEASATQLVYLYNEIAKKYRGAVDTFFSALGHRDSADQPSLRVASIDIGGGTSDLIITDYRDVGSGGATVIEPEQKFREGFPIAGDDVVRTIIERIVLRLLMEAMGNAGVFVPKDLCNRLFGSDFSEQTEAERTFRAQAASQLLVPIALYFLHHFEHVGGTEETVIERAFGEFFTPATYPRSDVIAYVDDAVRAAGGRGFELATLRLACDAAHFAQAVHETLGEVLGDLCEIVYHYRCDVLLLSGRTSRIAIVRQTILAALPLPPHRVIPLANYRVGTWYPFREPDGTVGDPKTTAAVGAMLCALAEGSLEGFAFHAHRLQHRSTARFFGPMDTSGRIQNKQGLFSAPIDLDNRDEEEREVVLEFHAPIQIGFRQLLLERWPVTPFYLLDFADSEARRRSTGRTPYKVTLEFLREAARDEEDERQDFSGIGDLQDEGAFTVADIETANGDPVPKALTLRLQTLRDGAGHWLDTGAFTII